MFLHRIRPRGVSCLMCSCLEVHLHRASHQQAWLSLQECFGELGFPSRRSLLPWAMGFRPLKQKLYWWVIFLVRKLQNHAVEHFFNYRLESRFLLGLLFVVQTVQSSYFVGRFLKWNLVDPCGGVLGCGIVCESGHYSKFGKAGFSTWWMTWWMPPHFGSMRSLKGLSSAIYCTFFETFCSLANNCSSKMDMQKIERIHPFCIFLDFSASESGSATMAGATGVRGAFQGLGGKKLDRILSTFWQKVSDSWHSRFKGLFHPLVVRI